VWARGVGNAQLARDLYRECLALDPQFAPAWAAMARALRFIQKFGAEEGAVTRQDVEDAFRRAFALNPDLALAHNFYTATQCDFGRAPDAMVRLLERARSRRNDADLFAGLVQACRYSGELEASLAAHERVRLLDPHVATSVAHTYFLLGDYRKTVECYARGTSYYLDCAALAGMGQEGDALERLRQRESAAGATGLMLPLMTSLLALLRGDTAGCIQLADGYASRTMHDPEAFYYEARHVARSGDGPRALAMLAECIDNGFLCEMPLDRDPWLAAVREAEGFADLQRRLRERRREVHARFVAAGGLELV